MTDPTVYEGLAQLKTVLMTASAAGQSRLAAGYVMPDQYAIMPDVLPLPCVVVGELYNAPNAWRRLGNGLGIHEWQAEVLLFVAQGPLTALSQDTARAMLKTRNWPKAITDVLWPNQLLNGQALSLGEPVNGERPMFRYTVGHIHMDMDAREFWGMRMTFMVQQKYAPPMTPCA